MTEIVAHISEAVLIEAREEVAVVAPQETAVVVEVRAEAAIIVPQPEAVVVEVRRGPVGPVGPAGPAGADGHDGSAVFPDGSATGDIIRWNAATGDWESCAEPFAFSGIILTPMALWALPDEGSVAYNIVDNGIYAAVE
jgi:hypothetical protein